MAKQRRGLLMSFKLPFTLVCAVALLAGAGCSSTHTVGSSSSTSVSPSTSQATTSVAFSPSNEGPSAVQAVDPDAWRSTVIARISVALGGGDSGGHNWHCSISADGRYVAFESSAGDLVPGDTNLVTVPGPAPGEPSYTYNASDVFVLDRQTGVMERASLASDGTQGNANSEVSFISGDGRWVVFQSEADNLVLGDTNGRTDTFVHDRDTGVTERVSLGGGGEQGNGNSYPRAISADGRYVVLDSNASNLVPGDTNGTWDVFVRDRQARTIEMVSVSSSGDHGNKDSDGCAVTPDGRFVVYESRATNLVLDDTNRSADIFVRDRQEGITERVSVNKAGVGANHASYAGCVSADGRYVAFMSTATNLLPGDTSSLRNDVFVYDRQTKIVKRVSVSLGGKEGNNDSGSPSISADGRYVAFLSYANNLVPGDTNRKEDVFVRDLNIGATRRVSLDAQGEQANRESLEVALSGDGRWVVFTSLAGNLVNDDANEADDVFVTKARR